MKTCTRCKATKPPAEFQVDRSVASGRKARCKACVAEVRAASPIESDAAIGQPVRDGDCALPPGWDELGPGGALRPATPEQAHKAAPDGFHVRAVSTLYGPDGEVKQQWVKTNKDDEDRLAALKEAVSRLAEPFRAAADPVPQAGAHDSDLLCVIPLGDPHVGLYAWAAETGQDFNLEIAEANLVAAVDHLVDLAPAAEEGLLINLGDFFHADTPENRTSRSGHALDVDTRWSKVMGVGIRIMRRCIDRMVEKFGRVTVHNVIGNHDDCSAVMLGLCLANYYEREPRVHVDTSPGAFHWYRFGLNLIGDTHGHTAKPEKLPGVMSVDRARDWGETLYRRWYTGHVHHDSLKEFPGVTVETIGTLAPRDAWAAAAGFRSAQTLKLDVIHREFGLINRHTVGIQQLMTKRAS